MKEAMREAGLSTSDIDYINTHGTSTPVGDISEAKAIASLFGDNMNQIIVGATKSMTGHLLGAAGAIEAMCCVLSVKNNIIPPTINLKNRDQNIDPRMRIETTVSQQPVYAALNNSFGFGGTL
jgi:3-oxoacyl-[acyl-carrier-protein] synthase II